MIQRLGLIAMLLLGPFVAQSRAADITGAWRVTISMPDGETITGYAGFKQADNAVTGWVGPAEDDPIPTTGVVEGNKITLTTHPQPGRTSAFAVCNITLSDGKMTGTIDTNKGTIEFVRRPR
jgi:hypothetical protein